MTHDADASGLVAPRHREDAWSFAAPMPPDLEAFTTALAEYNEELGTELPVDDFVVIQSPIAIVQFQGVTPDSDGYETIELEVGAAGGPPLSFIPFLYRVHVVAAPLLREADHVFYEALDVITLRGGVPVLALVMGS